MKTLKIVFFGLVCVGLLAGCNKQEWLGDEQLNATLKAAPVTETVISVGSPNGVDDSEAFLAAFAAAAAPGVLNPVVQLEEGIYHLGFVEIREFCGTFKGMGMGKSLITTVADLEDDPVIALNRKVVLVKFVGGDVCMRDMTIMTPPGQLSPGVTAKLHGLVNFCSRNAQYASEMDYIKARIDYVEFTAHWENTKSGIRAEPDFQSPPPGGIPLAHVDLLVTNCSFNGLYDYGVLIYHLKAGKIVIGTQNNGNTFTNNSWAGLGIWSTVNVNALVEGNIFMNPTGTKYGIDLVNAPGTPPNYELVQQTKISTYNIQHNEFYLSGGNPKLYEAAIYVEDARRVVIPGETPALVQVKNNRFNLSNNPYSVFRTFHMSGMVIRNNQLNGNGQYGVMVRATKSQAYNENGLILGNNLSNSTFSVASVWLQPLTRNWTIVGGDLGETVLDQTLGAGNHLITGMNVNTSDVPLGQTIVDNLEEMREGDK